MKPNDAILIPDWPAPPNIRAVVTTRLLPGQSKPPFDRFNLGTRCGDEPAAVMANRTLLEEALGLPEAPRWMQQVHGIDVHDADAVLADAEPKADAAVTRSGGRVLAVLTADCLPVFICADDGSAVGIAHAGWRGLAGGVIEATLSSLASPPSSLIAWLGPAIGPRSYEVGDEVRAAFVAVDADAASAFVPTRPGHWSCDLYALARRRLLASGVHRIFGGGFDTLADARFYSYRRDHDTGRFASLIWIDTQTAKKPRLQAPLQEQSDAATSPAPLFARLLGDAFANLPPRVRELHAADGTRRYRGNAIVRRGSGWLSRLCAWASRLPDAASDTPIDVEIHATECVEVWKRTFGKHVMRSRLWQHEMLLHERLGLVRFAFALSAIDGVLRWEVRHARSLGLPLPARWFRGVHAAESEQAGRYRFEVTAALPLIGDLVHYEGWLEPVHD